MKSNINGKLKAGPYERGYLGVSDFSSYSSNNSFGQIYRFLPVYTAKEI